MCTLGYQVLQGDDPEYDLLVPQQTVATTYVYKANTYKYI